VTGDTPYLPPLLPPVGEATAGFHEGARRGELRIQTCDACGRRRHPPRPRCGRCRSEEWSWRPVSGRATVWSCAVPHPPLLAGFSELAPYNVIVVALEEDPTVRLVGNLVVAAGRPPNEIDPATVTLGEPVHVVFTLVGGFGFPQWVRET